MSKSYPGNEGVLHLGPERMVHHYREVTIVLKKMLIIGALGVALIGAAAGAVHASSSAAPAAVHAGVVNTAADPAAESDAGVKCTGQGTAAEAGDCTDAASTAAEAKGASEPKGAAEPADTSTETATSATDTDTTQSGP